MMIRQSDNIIFDAKLTEERDYWVKKLSSRLEHLSLPADYKRSAIYYKRKDSINLHITKDLCSELNRLTQGSSFLLYSILMAALKVCLHWYTGSRTIVVGSPTFREDRCETGRSNLLAAADEIEEGLSFRQTLLNVRDTLNEACARQSYPFTRLIEDLGLSEIKNRCPLFDVMLALREIHDEPPEVRNDLTIIFDASSKELVGRIDFNPKLFCRERVERFAQNFVALLSAGVKNIDVTIADMKVLTTDEERQLLIAWNDTGQPHPLKSCVHELFEIQVAETPDVVAVIYEDVHLTYNELNRRANQVARKLRDSGVGPEVCVGICLERSIEMVLGVLGCLKAGGAYVPLDPSYPEERLRLILEDAGVAVRLTAERDTVISPNNSIRIRLDIGVGGYCQERAGNLNVKVSADNLIYVIYTSGSTGRPKGVAMNHGSLANLIAWQTRSTTAPHRARTLQFASLNFDVSCQEMFSTWCSGGTLVLINEADRKDLTELPSLLTEQAIERLFLPYVALQQMAVACVQSEHYPTCLLEIITAGEQLQVSESITTMVRHLDWVSLHNQYGPTESHVVSAYRLSPPASLWPPLPPIGRAIANTRIYILDHRMSLIPIGAEGGIYLSGTCLGRSYLNDAELTAVKFTPDPFSWEAGARMYRTGDLGRFRLDGEIEFIGRNDAQVKIRGFRIELGEIEAVLAQHPSVSESVVTLVEDELRQKRLVAYLTSKLGGMLSTAELKRFCAGKLPEYSVPHIFVRLESLPLTSSGKIDRRALPYHDSLDQTFSDPERVFVAPRNEVEQLLANIWSKVLRVENVGVHDNFFELGGDSILSLQIVTRARQAGLQFMPKQLFKHQTIADLAPMAGEYRKIQIDQAPITGPSPSTPIQLWFFEQQVPNVNHWNMAYLFEARQPLDACSIRSAVVALLNHHDALRSRFIYVNCKWRQEMAGPNYEAPFVQIDLSALPEDRKNDALISSSTALQKSLNISEGPIFRTALYNFGDKQPDQLLIIIHHLVVDGVSWRLLLEDLQAVYQQITRGEEIQLPLKTNSVKQWAESLEAYERTGAPMSESEYWLEKERHWVKPLPLDHPEGKNLESSIGTVSVSLQGDETRALLRDIPRVHRALINDVLLTAVARALANWTGERLLLIDVEGHGREELIEGLDISRTVGWFTSIFPLILKLRTDHSFEEALKSVKDQLRRVPGKGISHGLLRYSDKGEALVEKLRALPKAQVSFNYLGQFDQALDQNSLFQLSLKSKGPSFNPDAIRPHLLYISGGVLHGRLQINFTYSKNLHDAATIEGLASEFIEALRALIYGGRDTDMDDFTDFTIDDFPLAELSNDELIEVMRVEKRL